MDKTSEEFFKEREEKEKEKLINSETFKNAMPLQQTEYLLAIRLRNCLRL